MSNVLTKWLVSLGIPAALIIAFFSIHNVYSTHTAVEKAFPFPPDFSNTNEPAIPTISNPGIRFAAVGSTNSILGCNSTGRYTTDCEYATDTVPMAVDASVPLYSLPSPLGINEGLDLYAHVDIEYTGDAGDASTCLSGGCKARGLWDVSGALNADGTFRTSDGGTTGDLKNNPFSYPLDTCSTSIFFGDAGTVTQYAICGVKAAAGIGWSLQRRTAFGTIASIYSVAPNITSTFRASGLTIVLGCTKGCTGATAAKVGVGIGGGNGFSLTGVSASNDTTVTGTLPSGTYPAGIGSVEIAAPGNPLALSNGFQFIAAGILNVSPIHGPNAGGSNVSINCVAGCAGGTAVTLKGTAVTGLTCSSDSLCQGTSAAGSVGTGDVVLSSPSCNPTCTKTNAWTYDPNPPPVINPSLSNVALDFTPYEGGIVIKGTGTNLKSTGAGGTWTVDGITITVTVAGGGTTFSFTSPNFSTGSVGGAGGTHGYFPALIVTTADGTSNVNGPFVMPTGTIECTAAWVNVTPSLPADTTAISDWNGVVGLATSTQGNAARRPIYRTTGYAGTPAIETTGAGGSGGVPQWLLGTLSPAQTAANFTLISFSQVNSLGGDVNPCIITLQKNTSFDVGTIEEYFPTATLQTAGYVGTTSSFAGTTALSTPQVFSLIADGVNTTSRMTGVNGTSVANLLGLSGANIWQTGMIQISNGSFQAHAVGIQRTALQCVWNKAFAAADFTGLGLYAAAKGWPTP